MKFKLLMTTATALVLALHSPAAGGVYTAYMPIDLHPPGARDSGIGGAGGRLQAGMITTVDDFGNAAVWSGSAGSFINLHPAGYDHSEAMATSGSEVVGYATTLSLGVPHAMLFTGGGGAINLNPADSIYSIAYGAAPGKQVGFALIGASHISHAGMWFSSAASWVVLHPAGYATSEAWGVAGDMQVGWAEPHEGGAHAILWRGAASSAINLNPPGASASIAYATDGIRQGGFSIFTPSASSPGGSHATLWSSSAMSVIDLHPHPSFGYVSSQVWAMHGEYQVGFATRTPPNKFHPLSRAMLWNGSADSFVDLHNFLPPQYSSSEARGMDDLGNIYGSAIFTNPADQTSMTHAIMWAVPEPSSLSLLLPVAITLLARHRRHR
jgi:hypothetical protein